MGCRKTEMHHYEYRYRGESEHWLAEYDIVGYAYWGREGSDFQYDSHFVKNLTVTYRGDVSELATVKYFKIDCSDKIGWVRSGGYDETMPLSETVFTRKRTTDGDLFPKKETIYEIVMTLDDEVETITLAIEEPDTIEETD